MSAEEKLTECKCCGGTGIEKKPMKPFCSFTIGTTKFCSNPNSMSPNCRTCTKQPLPNDGPVMNLAREKKPLCTVSTYCPNFEAKATGCENCTNQLPKDKLPTLKWNGWPDVNDGWTMRMVNKDGSAQYTTWSEALAVGDKWGWTTRTGEGKLMKIAGTFDAGDWENSLEKHPRYDDIIWFQKWQGKTINYPGKTGCYTVKELSTTPRFFVSKKTGTQVGPINDKWQEVTPTAPLTPLDFRNIRGIRYRGWAEGCEQRILSVETNGVATLSCTSLQPAFHTFKDLATANRDSSRQGGGKEGWWSGYTFDGQVVSLAKTSYEEL